MNIFNSNFDKDTGWFFLEHGPWIVYLRLFNQLNLPRPSHCHQDFGSPVIFHNKKELIIDPGRSSYSSDSIFETYSANHSTFLINNKPTAYSERDFKFFPLPIISFKLKQYIIGKKVFIIIRYPLSLGSTLKIRYAIRLLVIKENSIEIRDRISLLKKSIISSRFNFAYPLDKIKRHFFYKIDKSKTKKLILSEESNEFLICNRFINYDRIDKYKSFNFRAKTNNIFRSRMLILE